MKIKEWIEQGKERFRKFGLKEWGMLLLVGICCFVIMIPTNNREEKQDDGTQKPEDIGKTVVQTENSSYVEQMEKRLENLLSHVAYVGNVKVMITVSSTEEKNVLKDGRTQTEEVSESDGTGGTRIVTSNDLDMETVFSGEDGNGEPYLVSESYPEVVGVVVLAEGSGTGSVDYDILNAVQVLFDIPAHKIKIMKMK